MDHDICEGIGLKRLMEDPQIKIKEPMMWYATIKLQLTLLKILSILIEHNISRLMDIS